MEIKGIDVSKHNGIINWKAVADSGVKVAIIRAGYGKVTQDQKFICNIEGALFNNIEIGIYWFIYATNLDEVIANADKCDSIISKYKDKIKYRVWADWEYDSDSNSAKKGIIQTKETRTEFVKAFCDRLKSKGYDVGIYANPDYIKTKFADISGYPLWLAQYSSKKSYDCVMWQYTSKGSVPGITGNVDVNIVYVEDKKTTNETYPTLKFGSKGEYVVKLQTILNEKGFVCGKADGIFGRKTESAVISFQGMYGLKKDGIVGKQTWGKLLNLS